MKNYNIKSIFKFLLLPFLLISCEDYLEESPDDRLFIDDVDKAAKIVAASYSQASFVFTDMYTDLVGPTGNTKNKDEITLTLGGNSLSDNKYEQIYRWEDVTSINDDTPYHFWTETYQGIAHTNEVLEVIDNLKGDTGKIQAVKAEALISRAFGHFMLVNMFGLQYNEVTAGSDLGVTYITSPETEFSPKYTRNTVKEVYDLAEADLLEGLSMVDDKLYSGTKKYHFTKKATQAFASRFYLWKKDYKKCKQYSDLFLGANPSIYVKDYTKIQGSGYNDSAEKYGNPEDDSNILVMQKFSAHQRRTRGFRLNDSDVTELFRNPLNTTDARTSGGIWEAGTDARYLARLRELFFRESLSSNVGEPYHISNELKGEEVIFNRAEAHLLDTPSNFEDALADINIVARMRYGGAEYTPAVITEVMNLTTPPRTELEVITEILLNERKKEFWDHGLRWFDIKRFNLSVTHQLPISEGGELLTLTEDDLRKAIQIPQDAIDNGLTPNPR